MSRAFADLRRRRAPAGPEAQSRSSTPASRATGSAARRSLAAPPPGRRRASATSPIVRDPLGVRPYVSLLNTSAWLLYARDVDPGALRSGVRSPTSSRTATGWRTRARSRSPPCRTPPGGSSAPTTSAPRSPRPPRAARGRTPPRSARSRPPCRGCAGSVTRRSGPPLVVSPHRSIPGTGLLVPPALEDEPPRLVERWSGGRERRRSRPIARVARARSGRRQRSCATGSPRRRRRSW